jgi:hypothetical protein
VPGDTNLVQDVFIRDRKKNTIKRLSVDAQGDQTTVSNGCGSIDASGRFVVFWTPAPLIAADTNRQDDVYVVDLRNGKLDRVSVASDGSQISDGVTGGTYSGCQGAISRGGRFVVYNSRSPVLVPNDRKVVDSDVFLFDRRTRRTTRISVNSYGEEKYYDENDPIAIDGTSSPWISGNGRHVVFNTRAINFFPDDREQWGGEPNTLVTIGYGDDDVFVHDVKTGATNLVSIDVKGKDPVCKETDTDGSWSLRGSISRDGRRVAYLSCGFGMVPGDKRTSEDGPDGDDEWQIYLRKIGPDLGTEEGSARTGSRSRLCLESSCLAPYEFIKVDDEVQEAARADIIGTSIAYRPQHEDLFASIEVEKLSMRSLPMAGGVAHDVYGIRFRSGRKAYEIRAGGVGGGDFGLYDCTRGVSPGCLRLRSLSGGYGTTGERVVVSVPLEAIDAEDRGSLSRVEAFSALGSVSAGALLPLDELEL